MCAASYALNLEIVDLITLDLEYCLDWDTIHRLMTRRFIIGPIDLGELPMLPRMFWTTRCDVCQIRATHHQTELVGGTARETHYCSDHAPSDLEQELSRQFRAVLASPERAEEAIAFLEQQAGVDRETVRKVFEKSFLKVDRDEGDATMI